MVYTVHMVYTVDMVYTADMWTWGMRRMRGLRGLRGFRVLRGLMWPLCILLYGLDTMGIGYMAIWGFGAKCLTGWMDG